MVNQEQMDYICLHLQPIWYHRQINQKIIMIVHMLFYIEQEIIKRSYLLEIQLKKHGIIFWRIMRKM